MIASKAVSMRFCSASRSLFCAISVFSEASAAFALLSSSFTCTLRAEICSAVVLTFSSPLSMLFASSSSFLFSLFSCSTLVFRFCLVLWVLFAVVPAAKRVAHTAKISKKALKIIRSL